MRSILISAFACKPGYGSEYEVGYQLVQRLAQYNNIILITESDCATHLQNIPSFSKIKVFAISSGAYAQKIVTNQGRWDFYIFYRIWQLKSYFLARTLLQDYKVDLVHHLNFIGFRETGFLSCFNLPFIVGPLGGFGYFKLSYLPGVPSIPQKIAAIIKNILNAACLCSPQFINTVNRSKVILSAYPESQQALRKFYHKKSLLVPETGTSSSLHPSSASWRAKDRLHLIWIGKSVARKMFDIAYQSYIQSNFYGKLPLVVLGSMKLSQKHPALSDPNIIFMGRVDRKQMFELLSSAICLLHTSIHEGNPHVIFEAISTQTPVICHDCYGMSRIVDTVGIKIPLLSYKQSVLRFTAALNTLEDKSFLTESFRSFLSENSWDVIAEAINNAYSTAISS